ncbi:PREDICTED: uncharacterized protein LOC109168301 [Ipomoea nil]|uniref:uncharacterized protein LOC109168301 n=1 Tax=Ipomoea nil TaxID=35883 RepID=UPI000900E720|nr:PREDICTED: uncharacterized protein LOC109168301 [Ipomoea nil]
MHAPTVTLWEKVKRVLRYVKGTLSYGLRIQKSESRELNAFSNSDWAGCPKDRKSTSGYAVFLGSNLVSWVCKKQRTMARSSMEAEYKGLADVCAEKATKFATFSSDGLSVVSSSSSLRVDTDIDFFLLSGRFRVLAVSVDVVLKCPTHPV